MQFDTTLTQSRAHEQPIKEAIVLPTQSHRLIVQFGTTLTQFPAQLRNSNFNYNSPIVPCDTIVTHSHAQPFKMAKGLFTWSAEPRSSGVGFFCFHALGDTKQKKPTPLDRGPPTPCKQGLNLAMDDNHVNYELIYIIIMSTVNLFTCFCANVFTFIRLL